MTSSPALLMEAEERTGRLSAAGSGDGPPAAFFNLS